MPKTKSKTKPFSKKVNSLKIPKLKGKSSWNVKNLIKIGIVVFVMAMTVIYVNAQKQTKTKAEVTELLYLSDSMATGDGKTSVFQVNLDSTTKRANLTEVYGSPIPFDQVDAIAASPDGRNMYVIDSNTTELGILTLKTGEFKVIGKTNITGIVLASTYVDGSLYVLSQNTDEIYTLNISTAETISKGKIYKDGSSAINISGADIAFTSDGKMYLWTNAATTTSPKGLYLVDNINAIKLSATYKGVGTGNLFSGLAVKENGRGDLVGSESTNDTIVYIDKDNAAMNTVYAMYKNGVRYRYSFGDMTAGPIVDPLQIETTQNTSYNKEYVWNINKKGSATELTLQQGQTEDVTYEVSVTPTEAFKNIKINGTIAIYNKNIVDAYIYTVEQVAGNIAGDVSCSGAEAFPHILPAGGLLTCIYTVEGFLSTSAINNVVNVTTNGVVEGAKLSQPIVFGEPLETIDECISVNDDKKGNLAESHCGIARTFNYTLPVGPYDQPGTYTFTNVASLLTADTKTSLNSQWDVNIKLASQGDGCTYTQGYWKTHLNPNDKKYNKLWELYKNETLSGIKWETILNTPTKGNVWYILAHQYISAKLNISNGASSTSEIDETLAKSQPYLLKGLSYTPTKEERELVLKYSSTLDRYNNGLIGPGHCD
jgi:hypothetical protein